MFIRANFDIEDALFSKFCIFCFKNTIYGDNLRKKVKKNS